VKGADGPRAIRNAERDRVQECVRARAPASVKLSPFDESGQRVSTRMMRTRALRERLGQTKQGRLRRA